MLGLPGCGVIYKNEYFVPEGINSGWKITGDNIKVASTLCNGREYNVYPVRINVEAIFIGPIIPIIPLPASHDEHDLLNHELELFIYVNEDSENSYLKENSLNILDDNSKPISIVNFSWRREESLKKTMYTRYTYKFKLNDYKTKILKLVFKDPNECELDAIELKKISFKDFDFAPNP